MYVSWYFTLNLGKIVRGNLQFLESRIKVCGNCDECDLNKTYKPRRYFIKPRLSEVLSKILDSTLDKRSLRTNLWIQLSMLCIPNQNLCIPTYGYSCPCYALQITTHGYPLMDTAVHAVYHKSHINNSSNSRCKLSFNPIFLCSSITFFARCNSCCRIFSNRFVL